MLLLLFSFSSLERGVRIRSCLKKKLEDHFLPPAPRNDGDFASLSRFGDVNKGKTVRWRQENNPESSVVDKFFILPFICVGFPDGFDSLCIQLLSMRGGRNRGRGRRVWGGQSRIDVESFGPKLLN